MKVLLLSDEAPYSTFDVFKGYCSGFSELKIPFEVVNFPMLFEDYTKDKAYALALAKMLIKENDFSHCLMVAGTMVPRWFLESKHNVKLGYIATDDPHSSKMLLDNMDVVDYYFCNGKNLEDPTKNRFYVPVGVSRESITQNKCLGDKNYQSDICFIGSVYPNRVKPLETICKWAKKNDKKVKLIGPLQASAQWGQCFVPDGSIIHQMGTNGLVNNEATLCFYANSKVVINMDRDVTWSPCFKDTNPHLVNANIKPYSMNPRVYETAACKVAQLYINPRQEAIDTLNDNCYYAEDTTKSINNALDQIFTDYGTRVYKQKVKKAYDIVVNKHTYTHRAAKIVEHLIRS